MFPNEGCERKSASYKSGRIHYPNRTRNLNVNASNVNKSSTAPMQSDGPTINGHPILKPKDVQNWFERDSGVTPPLERLNLIAQSLNHCALFVSHWDSNPEFSKARRTNPATLRMQRISKALKILQSDLPCLVADTLKVSPQGQGDGLTAVYTLSESANAVAPAFQKVGRQRRGRPSKGWHRIVHNLGPTIIATLKSCGIKRAGFGQATSPAVNIMHSALEYLGVEVTHGAIVDAVRNRKKPGKFSA